MFRVKGNQELKRRKNIPVTFENFPLVLVQTTNKNHIAIFPSELLDLRNHCLFGGHNSSHLHLYLKVQIVQSVQLLLQFVFCFPHYHIQSFWGCFDSGQVWGAGKAWVDLGIIFLFWVVLVGILRGSGGFGMVLVSFRVVGSCYLVVVGVSCPWGVETKLQFATPRGLGLRPPPFWGWVLILIQPANPNPNGDFRCMNPLDQWCNIWWRGINSCGGPHGRAWMAAEDHPCLLSYTGVGEGPLHLLQPTWYDTNKIRQSQLIKLIKLIKLRLFIGLKRPSCRGDDLGHQFKLMPSTGRQTNTPNFLLFGVAHGEEIQPNFPLPNILWLTGAASIVRVVQKNVPKDTTRRNNMYVGGM
ncbi:hypothetical protein VP01_2929g2 [Puccinia sorghi]|uniref:Uncharacterized protein n=1 Tax=Puccinia sorghi TaxID=27349 RepID=A0A0L6V179_9BASI|nr:hypothetical protein VP01_2929g2 [Puccinia sorghi]